MKRIAFIWKKSVMENFFKCRCGCVLARFRITVKDGEMPIEPDGKLIIAGDGDERLVFCPECTDIVAVLKEMNEDDFKRQKPDAGGINKWEG